MGKYSNLIDRIPLYIAIGQSNMDGRGYYPSKPVIGQNGDLSTEYKIYGTNANMVTFWRTAWNTTKDGSWQNSDLYVNNVNPSGVTLQRFGFESPFLKEMSDYKGKKVALIKAAEGGTSLHTDWQTSGATYQNAIAHIEDALSKISSLGVPELKSIMWYQGWSDCDTQINADNYEGNLNGLITNINNVVNTYLPNWDSKWLICESPDWVSVGTRTAAPYNALILAQSNVGNSGNNLFLDNTNMSLFTDDIHLTGASFEQLGIDCFNILKDL